MATKPKVGQIAQKKARWVDADPSEFEWAGMVDAPVATSSTPAEQDGPMARGVKQVSASVGLAGRLAARDFDGAAKNISDQAAYRAANPGSEEAQGLSRAWQQGDGIWGGIKAVAGEFADDYERADGIGAGVMSVGRNLQAMGSSLVEQVPNMALPVVGMLGGGAAGSAAAGPVGTVAGGWVGASAGNALVGTSEAAFRQLEKAGVDPSDAAAVREYLARHGDAILGETAVKGGVIGAVDVATAGLAHWLLSGPGKLATTKALTEMGVDIADKAAVKAATQTPVFKNLIANDATYQATKVGAQKLLRNTGAAATEPVGEFAGEYGGSLAATGEADAKDAFLEAASSLGQSGIMFAGQKAIQAIKSPSQAAADTIRATKKVPESGALTKAVNAGVEAKAQAVEAGAPVDGQIAPNPAPDPVDDPVRDQILALPDGARQDALRAYAVVNRTDVAKGVQQYNRKLLDRLLTENAPPPVLGESLTGTDMGTMLGGGGMAGNTDPLMGALGMGREAQANSITNVANVAERRPPMPASDAARMLDEARNRGLDLAVAEHPAGGFVLVPPNWVTPDMAAHGEARLNETIARMQQADAAPVERAPRTRTEPVDLSLSTDPVQNYIDTLRTVNTRAARAYVRDFDAGRITPADVQQRMVADQGKTPDQRIAQAAAEAPAQTDQVSDRLARAAAQGAAVPAPTDILNPVGLPFKTRMAADRAAKQTPGTVVPVEGGFVVRPQESVNVQDVPQTPEVPQAAPAVSQPAQAPQAVGAQPAGPAAGVPAEGAGAVEAAGLTENKVGRKDSAQIAQPESVVGDTSPPWASMTPDQRRRTRLEQEIATGMTNNGGVMAKLRPSAIEKRKQELAAMPPKEAAGVGGDAAQIAEAVSKADRLDLKGAERTQWVHESLSVVWGMTPDEVRDVPAVAAALKKKPSKEDTTAATVRAVEQVVRQANQAVALDQQAPEATENVASNSTGQDEKARWLKSVADMNRMSGQFGAQIDGVTNGRLSVAGNPNATKQGRALMAAVDEARRAGATNEEIAQAAAGRATAAPQGIAPAPAQETIHNGARLYPTKTKVGDEVKSMWAVESPDNQRRRAAGERAIGGDSLHDTLEQAQAAAEREAKRDAAQQAAKAEQDAADKERLDAEEARKAANRPKTLMEHRKDAVLSKQVLDSETGNVMTRREWVENKVADGLKTSITQEDKIKPMSRRQIFRADNLQQAEHDRKVKEAGKKDVYWLGDFEVTKIEYDYAQELKAQRAAAPIKTRAIEVAKREYEKEKNRNLKELRATESAYDILLEDTAEKIDAMAARANGESIADIKKRGEEFGSKTGGSFSLEDYTVALFKKESNAKAALKLLDGVYAEAEQIAADIAKAPTEPTPTDPIAQSVQAIADAVKGLQTALAPKVEGKEATRETVTPADDKNIGVNVDGNQLYERKDGSIYQMQDGKPRFGGFLEPVSASKEAVAPADTAQAATENVAISSNGQDEKAIRYELPPEKYAQQQGDESWMAAQSPSFKPTARQQLLMDAVAKALDDGAFYNSDVDEHVAKALGVTLEQRARNSRGVEGGDFGYDVYNATRAVQAQRSNAKSREFAKALNLKPGDVLGTLVFNDGKVTTGVKVNGLNDSGLVVTVTGKRGAATLNGEVGIDRLAAAMDSAKERGKRKDGYAEFVAGRGAVQPSLPAPATHADPGQAPEVATPAVVAQSVQKAARNEDTKPSEMRKWLVGKIDEAIAVAPEAAVDFLSFDVPGDGTFKVQNSQARLQEFRKKVMASPGFKDGGQKQNTKPPEQVDSAINGSGSTVEALRNFLADGDVQGAIEFAKLKGVEFTPVPPQMKMSADGKGKVKHMPASVKSSVPSVAEGLTQVEAEQINQYLTAERQVAEAVAQPITRADVTAAQQQAAAIITERIDAMTAGEVNTIARRFLPTMGVRPTVSKERNKAAVTDFTKVNPMAAADEFGATLPADVRRALQADMEGAVADGFVEQGAAGPASKTPTIDRHNATMAAVREGKATAEQFRASFEQVVDGKAAIVAELDTMTKVQLLREGGPFVQMRYANEKKADVVDAMYREMVGEYALGESVTYGMARDSYQKAVRRLVEATDAGKLARYVADRKAAAEEYAAQRAAKAAALESPQTLTDYRGLIQSHINEGKTRKEAFLMLTPEQRIQYDTLEAEGTKEARESRKRAAKTEVRTAGQTTGGEIIATKHTRDGYDLFVVKLADRLSADDYKTVLASAKKLGGWYSAFRGNGAIPGFQFKDKTNAEAFLALAGGDTTAAQEQVAQRRDAFEDDRSQTAVERLRAMADKLDEGAAEVEGQQRKTNTERRARFASAALQAAAADKAKAQTMRNIAQAIEDGKSKFLDAIRTKSQVDMLTSIVDTAKGAELRAKYPSYADQEKRKGAPPTAETADFADFPSYGAFRSDLATLGRQLLEVDGTKKLGQRLMSVADDVTDAYLEFAKANIQKVSQFGRGDELAEFASKDEAERAIKRSGLTGKAIVLPIKRGQNRVILSPSEAIGRGLWQGDGDKRITLTAEFGAELVEAIGRRGNKQNQLSVPWQFQNAYDRRKALSRIGIETPSEFRAALREFVALQETAVADKVRDMELSMVGRKADGLDFFPTPAEVADQMVEAADIQPDMAVLEPSAGMGHLADRIREAGAEPDVIEIASDRRALLEEKGYTTQDVDDFLDLKPREFFTFGDTFRAPDGAEGIMRGANGNRVRLVNAAGDAVGAGYYDRTDLTGVAHNGTASGYDRIIMNPPFSNRRDAEHVRHAYSLLKPGGRIVAIMGEGVFFGNDKKAQEFREWLESVGGTSEKLPDGSFLDPSLPVTTGANARMVVIDKADSVAMFSRAPAAFSFAGQQAVTADQHALTTAQQRLEVGEDAETVRQETGWFQGKDGKWRFEISDAGAQLAQQVYFAERGKWYPSRFLADARDHGSDTGGTGTLGDVLEHPALFAAYPALRDMPVTAKIRKDQESGAFDGRSITATAENEGRLLSVLLHEIQHGIQNIEGFATGGSIESARAMQADAQSNAFNQAQGAWYESRKRWPSAYKSLMDQRMLDGRLYDKYDIKTMDEDGNQRKAIVLAFELRKKISEADKALRSQAQLAYNDAVESELGGFGSDAFNEFNGLYSAVTKAFEGTAETATSVYKRLAGEVEARNTQARQGMTADQRRVTSPGSTADVADADVIVVFNGKEMANAPMPANAAPDAATTAQPLRTPAATIRAAITKAYGKLLGQLESKGLVTLTQTQEQAIEAAAQARAAKTGQSVERERATLRASVKNSVADQTQTENFQRWFKDSKVVDADGKPLVVYHGTKRQITQFDGNKKTEKDSGWYGRGIYMTADPNTASAYSGYDDFTKKSDSDGSHVMPLYASIQNPYIWPANRKVATTTEEAAAIREEVVANGHDGIFVPNDYAEDAYAKHYEVIAFRPEQIKSATGNSGAFDPTNPDIRRSADGSIQGFFDPQTGQSFLIADNLTAEAAPGVLMHEVGIHMAADGSMKALFNRAAMMLKLQRGNPFMKAVQDRMDAAGETSGEEAAAYIAEAYENDRANAPASVQRWLADLLAAVKAWMFKKGIMGADRLTVADIAAVARANAKTLARGQQGVVVKRAMAAFSRGTNEAMTNKDVVGKQGGRSADDTAPGVLFTDENDNAIVYEREGFRISVNRPGAASYVVLWAKQEVNGKTYWRKAGALDTNQKTKKVGGVVGEYLGVSSIEIEKAYRAQGLGLEMYRALMANAAPNIAGVISHTPNRVNKQQVPSIYRKLGAFTDGDNQIIPIGRNEPTAPDSGGAAFSRTATDQTQTDAANPDIRFSRTTDAAKAVGDTLKSITVSNVKQRAGFKLTDYLGIGLQALGRRQIVDIYGDLVPLAEYNRLVQQMEADKNEGGAEADQLVTRWAKLHDESKLADLMHEATLAQIDPDKPFADGDDKGKFLMLERKFKLLSDEAKAVYRDTRDAYKAHHAKVRSAIKERIERSEIKGERKAALLKQMDDEFFAAVKGVYFPLARFGQYAVTVKGPDGKVESVSRAETKAEAEALRNNLLSAFPRDKGFTVGRVMLSKDFIADRDAVGRGFMTELYQVLDKQDMDAVQRAELEDTLGQLYLSSLPDLSWAKHGIHRKGTPGFSQDARRAYAQNMFHGARYLAKLRYSDLMQDELTAMQRHVDDWREVEDFDQNSAQRVVDEMNKRHESLMNPKSNALSTALTSLGFVFHLGLSPASAMVNLSQTALVAYPIMGAKWGFGKASAALLKASAEAAKGKNDITGSLNEDERAAYDEAVRAGTIDVTMAHDLAGIAQGEDAGVMWKIRPVMRWASFLFHHAERFNRQVTFVAAYRLAREAGADHKAAFEQATKATYDGHFDYGAANRPRIMQGNVAKVLLLFKQYGQNMVYTLARNAQQAIKGESPEVRAQARKALGGLLATHAAAAGVLGLPMVTTLLAAASMIGGDDDEPWDAKVALQNMLADTFGQKPAEVLAHGLSRLTPWDISGRVGLDRLIFPDVQEGLEGQRLAESAMAAALGPVAGIGVNVLKGAQHMSEGRYALGLESMLPSALRGPVKAIRYANEGVQDKSGISILDEVSPAAVAGQALGFSPSQARNAQEGKSAVMAHDRALWERRQSLLTKAASATMDKDTEARAEAMKEIERFNQKNPTRRITPLNVLQSVRNRQKRIDQADGGVYLPKNRRDAVEAGRFAVVD